MRDPLLDDLRQWRMIAWYNRDGRFENGIKWFRIGDGRGPGLWWQDTRVAPDLSRTGTLRLGHYAVAFLLPDRDA